MRLFTAEFVQAWYGRMLNIHPSLLPSFPGLDPHAQALNAGVKVSGATVHFVTPDTLAARILEIEHQIYPQALRLLASGKLRLEKDICRLVGEGAACGTLVS